MEYVTNEVQGIHNDDDLKKYMCFEETVRESFDNVQYKFLLLPHFKDGKGAIIVKTHHCFTDGLGFSTFFLALSDEYTLNSLPGLKPLPFIK